MPYTYLERRSACSVFCSRDPSPTDTGFRHQEPSHNRSPAVLRLISGHVLVHCPFREPMPPANVCHLSAAGTPTASWPSALSGCRCLLLLSATSALPILQPRPGPVPCRVANASCGCLPPRRRGYSNRVLVLCPGRRPKTISRRDASPRPRRRRGSLRSGAQPSSPAPFRRE